MRSKQQIAWYKGAVRAGLAVWAVGALSACTRDVYYDELEFSREPYDVVQRRHPPYPTYSRVMWSALPQPIPHRSKSTAPLISPSLSFELPNSSLGESVEALAQAIGFRWDYPKSLAGRRVSINMQGTVDEILAEIAQQARVVAKIDEKRRIISVADGRVEPSLTVD